MKKFNKYLNIPHQAIVINDMLLRNVVLFRDTYSGVEVITFNFFDSMENISSHEDFHKVIFNLEGFVIEKNITSIFIA